LLLRSYAAWILHPKKIFFRNFSFFLLSKHVKLRTTNILYYSFTGGFMKHHISVLMTALILFAGCATRELTHKPRSQPHDSDHTTISPEKEQNTVIDKNETARDEEKPAAESVTSPEGVPPPTASPASLKIAEKKARRGVCRQKMISGRSRSFAANGYCMSVPALPAEQASARQEFTTEQYNHITENSFKKVSDNPLSTFSIDVDVASYSNIRRFLNSNSLPPKDAVRIEEMINYFSYEYPAPEKQHPFSITAEAGRCPWKKDHQILHIGLQGRKISVDALPPSNLVFLLDVSGSMNSPDKLPLLKKALKLLVSQLRPQDRVAITVYAGSAGLVLQSTAGDNKSAIIDALDRLQAGGSTAGGAGIRLAYKTARDHFLSNGNNRVILATDGDFNVGVSSDGELVRMIEQKRKEGIYLTVLGFGTGNYKDSKMEQLADKGNGNYAYIDNVLEAKKVLVSEMGGTLLTIAKDVKIQIEFNPRHVAAYRLIGYENRTLASQDFNDDTKDAGELGAGHTVTALYEIIPAGTAHNLPSVDPLKYQHLEPAGGSSCSKELCTVKFRYKKPDEEKSLLIRKTVSTSVSNKNSRTFRFSAAVAGFGMLLRDSEHKGNLTYETIITMAREAKGQDEHGYRTECISLMERAGLLASKMALSKSN
jgi:Ca-activated chloride channel family protein